MNYQWSYGPAEVFNDFQLRDIVQHVMWWCVGLAEDGTAWKASGSVAAPAADPANFLPFESITAETVQHWVTSSLNTADIEAQLNQQWLDSANRQSVKTFCH